MPPSIEDYLSSDGAIEILCEISINGSHYSEIEEAVTVSPGTFDTRRKEGVELDLFKREIASGDGRTTHEYYLTEKGALLRWKLDTSGTTEAYHVYRDAYHRYQQKAEEITEFYSENPESLENDELGRSVQFQQRYLREDSTEHPYEDKMDEDKFGEITGPRNRSPPEGDTSTGQGDSDSSS